VLTSISVERIELLLGTTQGRVQVATVLACFAVAWLVDRRVSAAAREDDASELRGGVVRGVFPITALMLLLFAKAAFRKHDDTLFFDFAIPLAIALAGIRVVVYVMRRLFPGAEWLATSERAIAFSIWGALVLYFGGVGSEIMSWLASVHIPIGRSQVSLASMVEGLIVVVVTMSVALWFAGFLERRLMRTSINANVRAVTTKVLRALLVFIGVMFALQAIGFDLTLLSVFGGALGVGIGLGLQRLAANYIAGFAILLDKSIKLGDLITVDNRHGTVTEVTSRYVVLRGADGIESIVPNEMLVSTTVLNHTHNGREVRVALPFLVAFDTDVERVLAMLVEVAREEPRVLRTPGMEPAAFLAGFAESGLTLELGVWVRDPEQGTLALRSAIYRKAIERFAVAGIRIPAPPREFPTVGALPQGTASPGLTDSKMR